MGRVAVQNMVSIIMEEQRYEFGTQSEVPYRATVFPIAIYGCESCMRDDKC